MIQYFILIRSLSSSFDYLRVCNDNWCNVSLKSYEYIYILHKYKKLELLIWKNRKSYQIFNLKIQNLIKKNKTYLKFYKSNKGNLDLPYYSKYEDSEMKYLKTHL